MAPIFYLGFLFILNLFFFFKCIAWYYLFLWSCKWDYDKQMAAKKFNVTFSPEVAQKHPEMLIPVSEPIKSEPSVVFTRDDYLAYIDNLDDRVFSGILDFFSVFSGCDCCSYVFFSFMVVLFLAPELVFGDGLDF